MVIYKVLKSYTPYGAGSDDVRLCSSYVTGTLCLDYKVGEWTSPKVGKLFAFSTFDSAHKYAKDMDGMTQQSVYKAVGFGMYLPAVLGIQGCPNLASNDDEYCNKVAKAFWTNPFSVPDDNAWLFEDTIFCDRIKILEKDTTKLRSWIMGG